MKKINLYILTALLGISALSCDSLSDFGDTNVNPGATTSPIPAALLTNVQSELGGYGYMATPGYYCQYFSETQYTSASLYAIPQAEFTGIYSGVLFDLQNIINLNENANMSAVASILQQYIFWTVTDRWGDVPYSEALKGAEFPRPKYDNQETIYKGMIQALKDANASFDNSRIAGDVIYNGDVASWKRFANSLRMLMALQLSKKYPNSGEYSATEFNAALNDAAGVISTNAQNFAILYPGSNFSSPWWGTYNGRRDLAESATMTNLMSSLGDTRQNAYGGATDLQGIPASSQSSNIGMPYGVIRNTAETFTSANPNWARVIRGDLRLPNSIQQIITAGQMYLARAEAADLRWTTENLSTVYNQGIALSFEQWGQARPANYMAQADVAVAAAGSAANKKNIAIQRYIATYPDGLQGWNIWRKTGFPVLTPAPDATNSSKQIPQRYIYGNGEYASNKANVEAVLAGIGAYDQDLKVWWAL